jgi:hypothetical protein
VREAFTPHLETLPPPQRRLWAELSAVPPEFVLYGGTALAPYFSHQESVDFVFLAIGRLIPVCLFPPYRF